MFKFIINNVTNAQLLITKYKNFIIYSIIGLSGASLDYLAFFALTYYLSLNIYLANIFSVTLGISNNFILNAFFNFKKQDKLFKRFLLFFGVGILGLGVSNLLLKIGIDIFSWNKYLVKFLSIFIVVILQYNLNKALAFGHKYFNKKTES